MAEEHDPDAIPDVSPETALQFGLLDLQYEDQIRDIFEDLEEYELEEVDRTILLHHLRIIYLQGWRDRHHGVLPLTDA